MDSLYMGCVSYSARYFAEGEIDKRFFKEAQLAVRKELEQIRSGFLKEGWRECYGSSGTAKALAGIISDAGLSRGTITREGLEWLRDRTIKAGNFEKLGLAIKPDRIPVLAGGLAIMLTVFEELDIEEMITVDTALRDERITATFARQPWSSLGVGITLTMHRLIACGGLRSIFLIKFTPRP
jgi:exopolyphosphatase/guanosine-5'-triphosphate,3'-diphosphate pyrophosphatase